MVFVLNLGRSNAEVKKSKAFSKLVKHHLIFQLAPSVSPYEV